jgi:hypothetical protein
VARVGEDGFIVQYVDQPAASPALVADGGVAFKSKTRLSVNRNAIIWR